MSSLKDNKMGVQPIGRLLFFMALPLALSMLVQAFYNVIDSMFVSRISDVDQDALNAVSMAFPVQNIMIGIATGISVGVNALLSRALGEKDQQTVNRCATNGLFLTVLGMLLCALFGIFENGEKAEKAYKALKGVIKDCYLASPVEKLM